MRFGQNLLGARVLAVPEHLAAGQIDPKRLALAVEILDGQLRQQFGHQSLGLRQIALGQGHPASAGQGFTGKMELTKFTV